MLAFVKDAFREDVEASSVEPIGHGEWSKAFYFRTIDGSAYVIRFSARDEDFLKDQLALGYASPRLPVPRLVAIGPTSGGYYAISERAFGDFIENRDQAAMQRLLPSLFDMLDACREVDVTARRGFGLWTGDGTAPHQTWRDAVLSVAVDAPTNRTHGWAPRLRQSEIGQRAFDAGYEQLVALVDGCPDERYLLHSDLLNFNVLIQDDRINAVLDWGSSMYGDFLWDLAWFTLWQPWYHSWSALDLKAYAREHYRAIGLEVPNFEERMHCYELAIGLDGLAYEAFAGHWENLTWTAQRVLGLV